jgi:hypothetical protein
MRTGIGSRGFFAAIAIAAMPAAFARASVSLIFDDGDSLPTKTNVAIAAGSTFTVGVYLNSTGEETTGLNYYLSAPGAGSGHFKITNRVLTGSTFEASTTDNAVVLNATNALLDPDSGVQLGGGLTDAQAAAGFFYGTGTFLSAIYTIQVLPGTLGGDYQIKTVSDANSGWSGSQHDTPPFNDHPFANQGTNAYTVSVTPEPGALGLLLMGAAAAVGTRRRRR